MVAALLIALVSPALAGDAERSAPTPGDRKATQGAVEVGIGTAAVVGGVALMIAGRGPAGAISEEESWVHEARTIGGGLLVIGGITTVLVGANHLTKAHDMKDRERGPTAMVFPIVGPHGGGLVLDARF